jgi:DNA-binding MarR family transcriptional regulator
MAGEDDIVESVTIEGADQAANEFEKVEQAGTQAFENIGKSADAAAANVGVIDSMAKRAGVSFEEMNARVTAATAGVEANAAANKILDKSSTEAAVALEAEAVAATEAAVASDAAAVSIKGLSSTLRTLGRATGIRELSQLGNVFRLLGRVGPAAIPAVIFTSLERLASSAAEAANKVGDLAAKAGVTNEEFQRTAQTLAGAGVNVDKVGAAYQGINKLFVESAKNTDDYRAKVAQLTTQQKQLERQSVSLDNQLSDLSRNTVLAFRDQSAAVTGFLDAFASVGNDTARQAKLLDDFSKATEQFNHANEVRQRQQAQLIDQQAELTQKQIENRKALSDAAAEFAKNGNVLDKLGISARDANGQIKKLSDDSLKQLADAFANLTPDQQLKATTDLLAAGIERSLIPALKKGAAGIDELAKKAQGLPDQLTPAQIAVGEKFVEAQDRFTEAIKRIRDQFAIAIAPGFLKFLDDATTGLKKLEPLFKLVGDAYSSMVSTFSSNPLSVINPVFAAVAAVVEKLKDPAFWAGIPAAASAAFKLIQDGANQALDFVINKFASGLRSLTNVIGTDPLGDVWKSISDGASAAWGSVTQFATDAWNTIVNLWNGLTQPIVDVYNSIVAAANTAWESIKSTVQSAVQSVISFFQPLIDVLKNVWDWAKRAASALGLVSAPAASPTPGFKRGGPISGPGTTTSDSIWARLSKGEFVIRAAAVEHFGPRFFAALNSMRMPSLDMGGLSSALAMPRGEYPGFAAGGLVTPPTASSGRPLQLVLEGQTFDLQTRDADTGKRMERYLTRRSMKSGGRRGQAWSA